MSNSTKAKLRHEVAELRQLLSNAAKESPQLWATIQRSVGVAELTTDSIQANEMKETTIFSGAETNSHSLIRE